jgi:hypothetical protein
MEPRLDVDEPIDDNEPASESIVTIASTKRRTARTVTAANSTSKRGIYDIPLSSAVRRITS